MTIPIRLQNTPNQTEHTTMHQCSELLAIATVMYLTFFFHQVSQLNFHPATLISTDKYIHFCDQST